MAQSYTIEGSTGTWEVVCGLEVHAQVTSQAKLFSGAATAYGARGQQPGLAGRCRHAGHAAGGERLVRRAGGAHRARAQGRRSTGSRCSSGRTISTRTCRCGYQISQYQHPIVGKGTLTIDLPDGRPSDDRHHPAASRDGRRQVAAREPADASLIDLNRSGVALMEIVSEPDIRTPEEAVLYLRKLRSILRYLGTCDGNMEEGSLRCDANVSVRRVGDGELGTRCEIKNVNSMRFVARAIEYEAKRQVELLEAGGRSTRRPGCSIPRRGETRSMRSKEEAHDYRYFPDPDLLPLELEEALRRADRAPSLPELPDDKKARFVARLRALGLRCRRARGRARRRPTISRRWPRAATPSRRRTGSSTTCSACSARPARASRTARSAPRAWASCSTCSATEVISGRIAKDVFAIMFETGGDPEAIVEERGLQQVTDTGAIEPLRRRADRRQSRARSRPGAKNPKVAGWFTGQVMKATGGKANPGVVNQLVTAKLGLALTSRGASRPGSTAPPPAVNR